MARRVTKAGYMALLKRRARLKKQGRLKAWREAGTKASWYRARLIGSKGSGGGRHASRYSKRSRRRNPYTPNGVQKVVQDPKTAAQFSKLTRTSDGKKVARLFVKFWKVSKPPSIKMVPGGPKNRTVPLVDMGYTNEAHLTDHDKGRPSLIRGKRSSRGRGRRVVRGKWTVATEKTGKHVLLLGPRPISGRWVEVGFAPETHYVPPPDVEAAGTHKKDTHWRHLHGIDEAKEGIPKHELHWPRVYADRGGKVDANSNFVYDKTKHAKISDWMYG